MGNVPMFVLALPPCIVVLPIAYCFASTGTPDVLRSSRPLLALSEFFTSERGLAHTSMAARVQASTKPSWHSRRSVLLRRMTRNR